MAGKPELHSTRPDYGFAAHSGDLAACFGVDSSTAESLTQPVALPAGTTRVRERGLRCFVTTGTRTKDTMRLTLQDADADTAPASIAEWSNQDAAAECAWEPFETSPTVVGEASSGVLALRAMLDEPGVTEFAV